MLQDGASSAGSGGNRALLVSGMQMNSSLQGEQHGPWYPLELQKQCDFVFMCC